MHPARALFLLPFTALLLPSLAGAVTPEEVVATAARLDSRSLDTQRSFGANGQSLTRPSFSASFSEGRFFPIVRDDQRVVGLVFSGRGTVDFTPPEGLERKGWDHLTDHSATSLPFSTAHFRFTDSTLLDLQDELPWDAEKDSTGAAFRVFKSRNALLEDPRWSRANPHLLPDQLMDLLGGGHVGGHLLAEFRSPGGGGSSWISALENPRGALVVGETHAIYKIIREGDAPPEVNILASWGDSVHAAMPFDVFSTEIDIAFPTPRKGSRKMVDAKVTAKLDVVALGQDGPLKALVLELEPERLLCSAQSDLDAIRLTRVVDGEGRILGAIHRGNRLFIHLAEPVARGESVQVSISYRGPMTQGIKASMPDVYFTELGPWAWYPRNVHPDRFASRVEAHLPRYMRAVAPGNLEEERKDKDGWHFVFAEPSGVANLTLVVGDLLRSTDEEAGANPKIIVWYAYGQEQEIKDAVKPVRQMVDFVSSLWGPYPYSTLHVVENRPSPALNWQMRGDSLSGQWSCLPPAQIQPWQGWAEGPSGMLLSASPTTAPSKTLIEAKALDQLFVTPVEVSSYTRIVDLTRQWWGHMVPPRSARDLWITEGISAWTGTVFLRAGVGADSFKERLETQRRLMTEAVSESAPLARGALLGRQFAPQVWGRGPLAFLWLADRVGIKVFFNALNGLINRASEEGITLDLLSETLSTYTDSAVADQFRFFAQYNDLPTVEYSSSINKETGEVTIVFQQTQEGFLPVDIPLEFVLGRKNREHTFAYLTAPKTVFRWTPSQKPKRIVVDPMNSAMVASLKKVSGLSP
jgi:hypothetical protein